MTEPVTQCKCHARWGMGCLIERLPRGLLAATSSVSYLNYLTESSERKAIGIMPCACDESGKAHKIPITFSDIGASLKQTWKRSWKTVWLRYDSGNEADASPLTTVCHEQSWPKDSSSRLFTADVFLSKCTKTIIKGFQSDIRRRQTLAGEP